MLKKIILTCVILMIALISCSKKQEGTSGKNKLTVFVSILPQKFFVEKIVGDKAEVITMVAPGFSPATYEPKPAQMQKLSSAKIYFSIGVPFEKSWLKKIQDANPQMIVVKTQKNVPLRKMDTLIELEEGHESHKEEHKHEEDEHHKEKADHDEEHHEKGDHDHEEHHHHHGGLDPHIWLSPSLVKIQAKNILDAVIKIDSKNKEYYIKNYNTFIKELTSLSQEIKQELSKIKEKNILVFHPAWGYLADEFAFKQIPIEIEGKSPSAKQLAKIIDLAKKKKIKVIIIQKQFSRKEAISIAKEIGAKVITLNPLAKDYYLNLKEISKTLKKELN